MTVRKQRRGRAVPPEHVVSRNLDARARDSCQKNERGTPRPLLCRGGVGGTPRFICRCWQRLRFAFRRRLASGRVFRRANLLYRQSALWLLACPRGRYRCCILPAAGSSGTEKGTTVQRVFETSRRPRFTAACSRRDRADSCSAARPGWWTSLRRTWHVCHPCPAIW